MNDWINGMILQVPSWQASRPDIPPNLPTLFHVLGAMVTSWLVNLLPPLMNPFPQK